jgi:hypothetical protein
MSNEKNNTYVVVMLLVVTFLGCILGLLTLKIDDNPNNIKYRITQQKQVGNTCYYSLGEIEYINNGCIRFKSYSYGKIGTTVVCGNFSIENYR